MNTVNTVYTLSFKLSYGPEELYCMRGTPSLFLGIISMQEVKSDHELGSKHPMADFIFHDVLFNKLTLCNL